MEKKRISRKLNTTIVQGQWDSSKCTRVIYYVGNSAWYNRVKCLRTKKANN
ncbi:MAG: hypothetical protein J6O60_01675 [Lachnospiraceae bacterium]|nr:hypothetical protein [Lachnospiraceae bacterium]